MSHRERILEYIRKNGSITHAEAEAAFGCARLAARVGELRKAGYPIMKRMKRGRNRYDEKISYAEYYLEETNEETTNLRATTKTQG